VWVLQREDKSNAQAVGSRDPHSSKTATSEAASVGMVSARAGKSGPVPKARVSLFGQLPATC
jgi:hypothetical protein